MPPDGSGGDSFLAVVEMAEAHDHAHPIQLSAFLLESPDEEHVFIQMRRVSREVPKVGSCFASEELQEQYCSFYLYSLQFDGAGFPCSNRKYTKN